MLIDSACAVIARSAALVLHLDAAFIMLPICRNFISLCRRTPLNDIIPCVVQSRAETSETDGEEGSFDKNIEFHKQVAWGIVFWSLGG